MSSCVAIQTPLCANLGYKYTRFPNILNHKSHNEAVRELSQFFPYLLFNCSSDLATFLCLVYLPPCTLIGAPIPPCRSLCEKVRNACQHLMKEFNQPWKEELKCENFARKTRAQCYEGALTGWPNTTGKMLQQVNFLHCFILSSSCSWRSWQGLCLLATRSPVRYPVLPRFEYLYV